MTDIDWNPIVGFIRSKQQIEKYNRTLSKKGLDRALELGHTPIGFPFGVDGLTNDIEKGRRAFIECEIKLIKYLQSLAEIAAKRQKDIDELIKTPL